MRLAMHALAAMACLWPIAASAQFGDLSAIKTETVKLRDGAWLLKNPHGIVLVSAGEDGVLMVDDQLAPLADRMIAAVATISDKPIRYVINTHFHIDHAGGNAIIHERTGATIIAQDNVRTRMMMTPQVARFFTNHMPAYPLQSLPGITYDTGMSLRLNGEDVEICHPTGAGHTDGDSFVYFHKANILHGGDGLTFGQYPFMDLGSSGSARGYAAALDKVLVMIDDHTIVIPSHGPLGDRAKLQALHDMVATVIGRVDALLQQGKSHEQVIPAHPSAEYDATYANSYIKSLNLVGFVYDDAMMLKKARP